MAKIKLKDLPRDMKVDERELRNIRGGFTFGSLNWSNFLVGGDAGLISRASMAAGINLESICKKQSAVLGGFNMESICKKQSGMLGGL